MSIMSMSKSDDGRQQHEDEDEVSSGGSGGIEYEISDDEYLSDPDPATSIHPLANLESRDPTTVQDYANQRNSDVTGSPSSLPPDYKDESTEGGDLLIPYKASECSTELRRSWTNLFDPAASFSDGGELEEKDVSSGAEDDEGGRPELGRNAVTSRTDSKKTDRDVVTESLNILQQQPATDNCCHPRQLSTPVLKSSLSDTNLCHSSHDKLCTREGLGQLISYYVLQNLPK